MKTSTPSDMATRYDRDGFLIIPDLLGAEECDTLKAEARSVLTRHASPGASVYVHVAVVSPAYRALAEDPRLMDILTPVMPEGVMFLSAMAAL